MLLALLLALSPPSPAAAPRDPFQAYDPSPHVGDGPLQVPLHQLRLEGVVADTAAPRALIRTPDGKSHVARIGDHVGARWGRITAIKAGRVVIRETAHDPFLDVVKYETVVLKTR